MTRKIQIHFKNRKLGGGVTGTEATCPEFNIVAVTVPQNRELAEALVVEQLRKKIRLDDSVCLESLPTENMENA